MSERPPDEPEDPWSDVIKQVHIALDDAQIDGESLRSSLLEGVRQALSSLEGVFEAETELPEETSPSVVVMEGGRTEDEPATESDPPELRLAEDGGDSEAEGAEAAPPPAGSAPVSARVRVIRTGLGSIGGENLSVETSKGGPVSEPSAGRIFLDKNAADTGQTLFRGAETRCYRLHCEAGSMRVLLDGQPVETLLGGQSMDVETRLLRVLSGNGGSVAGTYRRVGAEG